jgi:copper transport protein
MTADALPTAEARHDCPVTSPVPTIGIRRRVGAVLVAAALGLLGVILAPPSAASAHAALVRTSPAQNTTVGAAPSDVVLTFSEAVNPVAGKVHIVGPDGSRAERGDARAYGAEVRIPMNPDSPKGTYLVTYRVISADSHPIGGGYTFNVIAPSPGGPPKAEAGNANPDVSPIVTGALPVVRWLGYVGLLLLVGATLVLAALWPRRLDRRGPIRLIWIGAALVTVGTILELLLQVPYVAGGGLLDIRATDVREALGSQFGAAHLIRLGALGAALALLRPIVRGEGWGADRVLLAVLGVIGLATWSVSGHPSASTVPMVTVVADMVHLGSMSVWLGGLVMLIAYLLPRGNSTELAAIVPTWSRWATYAVSALVLTGVAQALVEIGSFGALVSTTYGRLVLVKAGLVGVVLGVALLSRRLVGPISGGTTGAVRSLRGVVIAEASIAAVVLAITGVLVQVTPARTAAQLGPAVPDLQTLTLSSDLYKLQVEVDPAEVGVNFVHLYAFAPNGGPASVQEWVVKAALPAEGIEPVAATVVPITADHATSEISLPAPGRWIFTFTLRLSEIDQQTVAGDVTIRP